MPHERISLPRRRWLPSRREAAAALAVAAGLLLLLDTFVIESVLVPTSSMLPTVQPNERLWVRHGHGSDYRRFETVVVNVPTSGRRIVKRIIGLPGEQVRLQQGWRVLIDGKPLDYSAGPADTLKMEASHHAIQVLPRSVGSEPSESQVTLGSDEYFLLGDNRLASEDSRVIGPVHRSQIQGSAELVWYSFDRAASGVRWNRLFTVLR